MRTVKYGETSLIADLYTREMGLVHTIAGGVRKAKSSLPASCFEILQPVQVVMYYKPSSNLNRIKEIKPLRVYMDMHAHPVKRSLLIFYAEVLQKSIREKESNPKLFDFLLGVLDQLNDGSASLAYSHLVNLIHMSSFLGFYPQNNYTSGSFFHLGDGSFHSMYDPRQSLDIQDSQDLSQVIDAAETDEGVQLSSGRRQAILGQILKYYRWHLPNFGDLKSPSILQSVLR